MSPSDVSLVSERLRSALIGQGSDDAKVVDLSVRTVDDLDDLQAWRVILKLTRPAADAWNSEATSHLKIFARHELDRVLHAEHLELEGATVVTVTTDQAPDEQIAAEDEPSDEETLVRDDD